MKKILALFFALVFMSNSFAIVSAELPRALKASQLYLPIAKTGKSVSLLELSTMSVKEYQNLSGQHLKLMDKLSFKMAQRELKRVINKDGSVNVKKLEALNKKIQKAASEDSKRYLRWALIFLGAGIILSLLGYLVPFTWYLGYIAYLASGVFFVLWLVNMAGGV